MAHPPGGSARGIRAPAERRCRVRAAGCLTVLGLAVLLQPLPALAQAVRARRRRKQKPSSPGRSDCADAAARIGGRPRQGTRRNQGAHRQGHRPRRQCRRASRLERIGSGRHPRFRLGKPVSADAPLPRLSSIAPAGYSARACGLCERRAVQPALRRYGRLGSRIWRSTA
jgi:hypothetical protein